MSTYAIGNPTPLEGSGFISPAPRIAAPAAIVGATGSESSRGGSVVPPLSFPNGAPPEPADSLEETLRTLESAVKASNIELKFSRHDQTGGIVIELIDQTSGEQVRQIPTEAALNIAAALGKFQGILFNRKA